MFDMISFDSFTNIWFWLVLAAFSGGTTHFVLGAPYDLIARAQRGDAQASADLDVMVDVTLRRWATILPAGKLFVAAISSFVLAIAASLGFWHGWEFGQAVFLLLVYGGAVAALSQRAARQIGQHGLRGAALAQQLARLRLHLQILGFGAIFITAAIGSYATLARNPFG